MLALENPDAENMFDSPSFCRLLLTRSLPEKFVALGLFIKYKVSFIETNALEPVLKFIFHEMRESEMVRQATKSILIAKNLENYKKNYIQSLTWTHEPGNHFLSNEVHLRLSVTLENKVTRTAIIT